MSQIDIAIHSVLIAVAYAVALPLEDSPATRWFLWLARMRDAGGWRAWIASPLGGCAKCFGGQLALWSSIIINGGHDLPSVLAHLGTAAFAVLSIPFMAHAYRWMHRRI